MSAERIWWRRRVIAVTDDAKRRRQAISHLAEIDARVEVLSWSASAEVAAEPVGALLALVEDPEDRVPDFEEWAGRALQPVTVAVVPPALGAARLASELERLRFPHRVMAPRALPWEAISAAIGKVLGRNAWMAVRIARDLGAFDPVLVTAITAGTLGEKPPGTPRQWARRADMWLSDLERLLARHGLVPPQEFLPCLRLWRAFVEARVASRPRTREQLAEAVGYRSGDYLGRLTKRLTGRAFGSFVDEELARASRLLASVAQHRAS